MDGTRVNVFAQLMAVPFVSKRFALKRFLGLTAEEMTENEKFWKEENIDHDANLSAQAEMRSAGITAGGISSDMSTLNQSAEAPEGMDMGMDATGAPQAPASDRRRP